MKVFIVIMIMKLSFHGCVRMCLCIFASEDVCEFEYLCLFLCEDLEDDMRYFQ